jgi:deoxyribonuclease-1
VAPWAYRNPPAQAAEPSTSAVPRGLLTPQTAGRIIGNRNSRIYHLPGCPSYNAVAERNRVYFSTEAVASAAGYRKARNC